MNQGALHCSLSLRTVVLKAQMNSSKFLQIILYMTSYNKEQTLE